MKGNTIYRKFIISLIGVCLFMPLIYSVHFYINRMLHRMEMWREAESKLLQTIELDSATIHWTKKNRELILNNEYFDVVKIDYKEGKAILTGLFDKEETKMHKAFSNKQNRDANSGNSTQKIADWLLLQWTFEDAPPTDEQKGFYVKKYPLVHSPFLQKIGNQPPVPPPWPC